MSQLELQEITLSAQVQVKVELSVYGRNQLHCPGRLNIG